jgi:hypothetical protein
MYTLVAGYDIMMLYSQKTASPNGGAYSAPWHIIQFRHDTEEIYAC